MSVVDVLTNNPYQVLSAVQIAALLAASIMLVYPVVAYAQNVAYTEGLVGLAVGFFVLTFSNLFGLLVDNDVIAPALDSSAGVRAFMNFGASICALVGIYYFTRQFIDTDDAGFDSSTIEHTEGFDDADD